MGPVVAAGCLGGSEGGLKGSQRQDPEMAICYSESSWRVLGCVLVPSWLMVRGTMSLDARTPGELFIHGTCWILL